MTTPRVEDMKSKSGPVVEDAELERLMDAIISAGRGIFDSWLDKDDAVRTAREALRSYVSGWKAIAESNRRAYEEILPFVRRNRINLSDPDVARRLAESEGISEVGAGFETISPDSAMRDRPQ